MGETSKYGPPSKYRFGRLLEGETISLRGDPDNIRVAAHQWAKRNGIKVYTRVRRGLVQVVKAK